MVKKNMHENKQQEKRIFQKHVEKDLILGCVTIGRKGDF